MSERVTVREFAIGPDRWVVDADFAHRLADELEQAKERIKRLEEAGDAMCAAAAFMGWHLEIEKWNKAKETKP